jgi:hypothetical protein
MGHRAQRHTVRRRLFGHNLVLLRVKGLAPAVEETRKEKFKHIEQNHRIPPIRLAPKRGSS